MADVERDIVSLTPLYFSDLGCLEKPKFKLSANQNRDKQL
jgi:hypothetical protein